MISWMSEETNRVIDKFGLAVYGFDNDAAEDAVMVVESGDDRYILYLGDVRGLTGEELNRRFYAAMCGLSHGGADVLSEVCDALGEQFRKVV